MNKVPFSRGCLGSILHKSKDIKQAGQRITQLLQRAKTQPDTITAEK
jgi:hypothetical protein